MTIRSASVLVGSAAASVVASAPTFDASGLSAVIQNLGTATLLLGGSNVSSTVFGHQLAASSTLSVHLIKDEAVFGIVTGSANASVYVLQQGIA
jgi:hypothetical protein